MAKLKDSCGLELWVEYNGWDEDTWLHYRISFVWKGRPIPIGDKSFWSYGCSAPGVFAAIEYESDSLISVVESVLATNTPRYWALDEPDVCLAFYPMMDFPIFDMKTMHPNIESHDLSQKKPDDTITVIALIDQCMLNENDEGYCGTGPALILAPERAELERFCAELKAEYAEAQRNRNPSEGE